MTLTVISLRLNLIFQNIPVCLHCCFYFHCNTSIFIVLFLTTGIVNICSGLKRDDLTLSFQPFWFWLQIRGGIHNWKTTPRLGESASRGLSYSASSQTRWVGESLWWVGESIIIFFKIYHHFKRLNQPFKRSIWQKRSQRCNVPLIYLKVWKKLYL